MGLSVRLKGGFIEAQSGRKYLVAPGQLGQVVSTAAQKLYVTTQGMPESTGSGVESPVEDITVIVPFDALVQGPGS